MNALAAAKSIRSRFMVSVIWLSALLTIILAVLLAVFLSSASDQTEKSRLNLERQQSSSNMLFTRMIAYQGLAYPRDLNNVDSAHARLLEATNEAMELLKDNPRRQVIVDLFEELVHNSETDVSIYLAEQKRDDIQSQVKSIKDRLDEQIQEFRAQINSTIGIRRLALANLMNTARKSEDSQLYKQALQQFLEFNTSFSQLTDIRADLGALHLIAENLLAVDNTDQINNIRDNLLSASLRRLKRSVDIAEARGVVQERIYSKSFESIFRLLLGEGSSLDLDQQLIKSGSDGYLNRCVEGVMVRNRLKLMDVESLKSALIISQKRAEVETLFSTEYNRQNEISNQTNKAIRSKVWMVMLSGGALFLLITFMLVGLLKKQIHKIEQSNHALDLARERAETALKDLHESENLHRTLCGSSPFGIFQTDTMGAGIYHNERVKLITGMDDPHLTGAGWMKCIHESDAPRFHKELDKVKTQNIELRRQLRLKRPNGELRWVQLSISSLLNVEGKFNGMIGAMEDINEQKNAESERQKMELQLRQAQKLESIGHLAAGIAHEINTPTQFIGDNLRFLRDAFPDLLKLLQNYRQALQKARLFTLDESTINGVADAERKADLDYLNEEIPKALNQSLDGVGRVAGIVGAMKEFSHPGSHEKMATDLNRNIENTLTVSRNEWKYVAQLETHLAPDLMPVQCLPNEFNQVVLNLVVNAAHAIADAAKDRGSDYRGTITVSTRQDGEWAEVRVSDTGTGIPERVRTKIFDPFFTTKEVGKGTGQGLAIARSVIVDKHGGTLNFETVMGQGTTFIIRLPLKAPEKPKSEVLAPSYATGVASL